MVAVKPYLPFVPFVMADGKTRPAVLQKLKIGVNLNESTTPSGLTQTGRSGAFIWLDALPVRDEV